MSIVFSSIKAHKLKNKWIVINRSVIDEYNHRRYKQQFISKEQELIKFIKQDPVFKTCTNDKLREIYLYNMLYNEDGSIKEHLKELAKRYFYITNQRTLRLTDKSVWLLHYLQNYEIIDAQNQQV